MSVLLRYSGAAVVDGGGEIVGLVIEGTEGAPMALEGQCRWCDMSIRKRSSVKRLIPKSASLVTDQKHETND